MLIPLVVHGGRFLGQAFPQTERVQRGVFTGAVLTTCLNPVFLLMVACMVTTASTELGPGQRIPGTPTNAGLSGMPVLVQITG
jgi:hypothetical protein